MRKLLVMLKLSCRMLLITMSALLVASLNLLFPAPINFRTLRLPYGKYTYKETFAQEGYLLNEEMFSFEIKEDGQIIKQKVKGQKKSPHHLLQ
ncbi:hypothetical protein ILT06_28270 [Bacillus sp. 17RED48]|nr:hypothetical protein [Bacillus sp. 17RED48]